MLTWNRLGEKSRTRSPFYKNRNDVCVWLCPVRDARLLIVVTLGSRRRRYFQLLLFFFFLSSFFFFFPTSMYYIGSLSQKHKSLLGSFPAALGQGPRSSTTRLDQAWDGAGPKHYRSPCSFISFPSSAAK